MASDANIAKQGYLQKWSLDGDKKKSNWQTMYFVLHSSSDRNAARLDWYDTEDQFQKNPGTRKALFVEEIKNCDRLTLTPETKTMYGSSAKYLMIIRTYRSNVTDYILKCDTEESLKEWLDQMKTLLKEQYSQSNTMRKTILEKTPDSEHMYHPKIYGHASTYDVEIDDTAAAIHCELQGSYRLILSQQHITLVDPESSNPVITWMYKHIRRFGYSERSLTIEGGSKCGIGKGLFIFKTTQGNELMESIRERIKACVSQEQDEYSYISFGGAKDKKPEESTTEPSYAEPTYGKINDKESASRKLSGEKPTKPGKPTFPTAAPRTPSTPVTVPQHKMSEVLSQMPNQSISTKVGEEDVYGYNHLNIQKTTSTTRTNTPAAAAAQEENPYGEQLVQKLQKSK